MVQRFILPHKYISTTPIQSPRRYSLYALVSSFLRKTSFSILILSSTNTTSYQCHIHCSYGSSIITSFYILDYSKAYFAQPFSANNIKSVLPVMMKLWINPRANSCRSMLLSPTALQHFSSEPAGIWGNYNFII